jgi:hypothetical protein
MPSNITTAYKELLRGGRSCDRDASGALAGTMFETFFRALLTLFVDSFGIAGLSKKRSSFTKHAELS